MTDGQLLVSIEGLTYTTYMQDLPDQYRVVVGNQVPMLQRNFLRQ
jgi:hypothetical protein